MATERELRTHQEQMIFRILLIQRMLEDGKTEELANYLNSLFEDLQSGMSNDEVDAVKERVNRARKPVKLKK